MRKTSRTATSSNVYLIGPIESDGDVDKNTALRAINSMLEAHRKLSLATPLTLYISTYGGDVNVAWAVCATIDRIRREGRKVIGHVLGFAWSGGFYILQHCDVRVAEATSTLMIHEIQHEMEGSTTSIASSIAHSKKIERQQFEIWARRSGKPTSYYVEKNAGHDWFMLPHEALEEKFIDSIAPGPKFPRPPKPIKPQS